METETAITNAFERLQYIRQSKVMAVMELLTGNFRSNAHAMQYNEIRQLAWYDTEETIRVIVSGCFDERQAMELLTIMGHGGSVAKRHNEHMIPIMAELRRHYDKLPEMLQSHLDWLQRVHGY